ncbi:MAG: hypothetical protein NTW83_03540 [Cyanobacteria bacterium]|nr:hypothetical protein [Cyanobacteriota bacterium]
MTIVHVDSADVIQAGDVWFTRKRLSALKRQGSSAEQAVAAQPQVDPEESWGKGLVTGDRWISVI